jgi:hypothetical protein
MIPSKYTLRADIMKCRFYFPLEFQLTLIFVDCQAIPLNIQHSSENQLESLLLTAVVRWRLGRRPSWGFETPNHWQEAFVYVGRLPRFPGLPMWTEFI